MPPRCVFCNSYGGCNCDLVLTLKYGEWMSFEEVARLSETLGNAKQRRKRYERQSMTEQMSKEVSQAVAKPDYTVPHSRPIVFEEIC